MLMFILNKLYSLPIFYLLMTILGLLIMMKFTFIKTKFFTIIVGVSVSVFVYYINYFSSLFGSNETIPIVLINLVASSYFISNLSFRRCKNK